MKKFTSIKDVEHPQQLLQTALDCKANPHAYQQLASHKTLVLLFFNPSLRTRLSTQKAGYNLGMQVISMNANQGWKLEFEDGAIMDADKAEHIKDAARVISQYGDILGIRTFPTLTDKEADYQDRVIQQFAAYASIPVVSLESAILHPLQSLADWMTITENRPAHRPKVVLSWAPHPKALPQAVANSFIEWMQQADVDLMITHPPGYELAPAFNANIPIEYNQNKALEEADFVYTKNWSSYQKYGKILSVDPKWTITAEKMALTNQGKFMHCLPIRRNVVATDAVLDSPHSLIIEQANNRTFAAQAVLKTLLEQHG